MQCNHTSDFTRIMSAASAAKVGASFTPSPTINPHKRPLMRGSRAVFKPLPEFFRCTVSITTSLLMFLSTMMVDLASGSTGQLLPPLKCRHSQQPIIPNLFSPTICCCNCNILAAFQGAPRLHLCAGKSRCRREWCSLELPSPPACQELRGTSRIGQHGPSRGA